MFKKLEPLKKWCTKFYFSKAIYALHKRYGFLSLSYDHRVIDGADAARFLKELENLIENPSF